MIRNLIVSFRDINIEVKPPKFNESHNPSIFLEKFDKFFKVKKISAETRIDVLDGIFDNEAKTWFVSNSFRDYDEFKRKLIEEYYSIPVRVRMKGEWLSRKFYPSNDNLNEYFIDQIKKAQYFSPAIEDYELHFTIIQQLPLRVREILSTADFGDIKKISNALSQLDLTFRDKQSNSSKFSSTQSDQFNRKSNENNQFDLKAKEMRFGQNRTPQGSGSKGQSTGVSSLNLGVSPCEEAGTHINDCHEEHAVSFPDFSIPPPYCSCNHRDVNSIFKNNLN